MHRSLLPRTLGSLILGSLAAVGVVAAAIGGCSEDAASRPAATLPSTTVTADSIAPLADTAEARSRIDALRSLFFSDLPAHPGAQFERTPSGAIRLAPSTRALQDPASVALPARADGAVRLVHVASSFAVSFSLEGASPAPFTADRGIALYRAAAPGGADLLHRVSPDGTEDLVVFEDAPRAPTLRYRLDLPAAAGLRLLAGTLEILDAGGVPRLRVAPPYVVDAAGARRAALLAVEGCVVDTSPTVPWGRPVTPPGADHCAVVVRWSPNDLRYPILVDPAWQSTASMVVPRVRAAVAAFELPTSSAELLLVTGGFDAAGNALASAEVYFPLERAFAVTGSLATARGAHTATNAAEDGSGAVLVAGGATLKNPTTPDKVLKSVELYEPAKGTFSAAGVMAAYRYDHSATLLSNGKILLAGGTITTDPALPTPQAGRRAELFDPAAKTTEDLGDAMKSARTAGAALRLGSGGVLLTGGFGTSDFAVPSAEIFDPATKQFIGGLLMGAARARHTMTLLPDGRALVAGGINAVKSPAKVWDTADLYTPGQGFAPAVLKMTAARAAHTATRLTTGEVLLAGGFDGTDPAQPNHLATTELFDPSTSTFEAELSMSSPRSDHDAALVLAGNSVAAGKGVVVLGGAGPALAASNTAEILLKDLGDSCQKDDECLSGHCAEPDATGAGVCCDQACDGVCRACRAETKEQPSGGPTSPTGTCGFAAANTALGWKCVYAPGNDIPVEILQVCDGKGNPIAQQGKSCVANNCDQNQERCSADCPCNDAGFCTDLGEDGGPGAQHCEVRMDNGQKCTAGPQCASGNCVDGFCCDTSCEGQCEACNVQDFEGKCQPAGLLGNTAPVGERQACAGQQGSPCQGSCDNNDRAACTYPGPETTDFTKCECADLGECTQTNNLCDAKGGSTPKAASCGGFGCSGDKCNASCAADGDCREDSFCENGGCKLLPQEGRCDGDHTIRLPKQKDTDCGAFKCAGAACIDKCASVDQCVAPNVCTLDGACIPPPSAPVLPSCSASGAGSDAPAGGFTMLASLAGLAAAFARRRFSRASGGL